MNVNKQQRQVINFLRASWRLRRHDKNVYEIQKVDEHRVIQLFEFFFAVKMLWVKTSDLLAFQGSDDSIVVGKIVAGKKLKVNETFQEKYKTFY